MSALLHDSAFLIFLGVYCVASAAELAVLAWILWHGPGLGSPESWRRRDTSFD